MKDSVCLTERTVACLFLPRNGGTPLKYKSCCLEVELFPSCERLSQALFRAFLRFLERDLAWEVLFGSVSRGCRLLVLMCFVFFPVLSCWCRRMMNQHVVSATVKVVWSGMLGCSPLFPKIPLFSEMRSSCIFPVGESISWCCALPYLPFCLPWNKPEAHHGLHVLQTGSNMHWWERISIHTLHIMLGRWGEGKHVLRHIWLVDFRSLCCWGEGKWDWLTAVCSVG